MPPKKKAEPVPDVLAVKFQAIAEMIEHLAQATSVQDLKDKAKQLSGVLKG